MAERLPTNAAAWKALMLFPLGRRLRRNRPGPVTALDVDGLTLRVVHAVPRGNRTDITRLVVEKLDLSPKADRSDPEVMGQAIAKALDRLRVRPSSVVMGVPRASVLLRTLSLPVIEDPGELAAVVNLQVSKDLPFRSDEAVVDFKVRHEPGPPSRSPRNGKPADAALDGKPEAPPLIPKLQVLVGVVKRDVVEHYQKTAAAAGLKLAALGLLPYGNARSVEACRIAEGGEGVAIVTLRPDEVGIDIVVQDSLLFSRGAAIKPHTEAPVVGEPPTPPVAESLPVTLPPTIGETGPPESAPPAPPPAAPPSQPETFVDIVTIEVVRSLHSYGGMEPQNPVAKVVVVGATGQEPAIVEILRQRLNIPCSLLDVVAELDLPKAAREHASGSISAIGLGLGATDTQGLPFDFLNPKRPAAPRDMRTTLLLLGGAALVAVMVFAFGLRAYLVSQRENLRTRLRAELVEARKKRPVYAQMRQQITTLQDWTQGGHNWLEHYAYLSAVLPPSEEVYISSLSISGLGTIRFSVQAQSGAILAKLDKQLRAAGYDVKPLAITPGSDKFGYDFRSAVEVTVPAGLKVDLSKVRPPPRPADDASLDPAQRKGGS